MCPRLSAQPGCGRGCRQPVAQLARILSHQGLRIRWVPGRASEDRCRQPAQVLALAPGDTVALISDGVFEYENASGEMFGNERVEELLAAAAADPAERQVQLLVDGVEQFAGEAPQNDDMTIVVLRRL